MTQRMFRSLFGLTWALIVLVALAAGVSAQGGKCTEISTVWTLGNQYIDGSGTRIQADNSGSYIDGSGVTARIRSCSTNDAVLILPDNGARQVMYNFGAFLGAGNVAAPTWTTGPAFASTPTGHHGGCSGSPCTVLNVRDVLAGGNQTIAPRDQYYLLYTRFGTTFVAPDSVWYRFWMHNPNAGTPESTDAFVNSPSENARVVVEHYPANYLGQGNKEYWLAYPEATNAFSPSPQNGTLLSPDSPPSRNYGQFSLPFYFKIQVK